MADAIGDLRARRTQEDVKQFLNIETDDTIESITVTLVNGEFDFVCKLNNTNAALVSLMEKFEKMGVKITWNELFAANTARYITPTEFVAGVEWFNKQNRANR